MAKYTPDLCKRVHDFIKKWDDHWSLNVQQYCEWMDFVLGNQWKDDEARVFFDYKKVPLTFNKLAPLANYLIGMQRQNTPDLEVYPDERVPPQAVNVRQALIKEISLDSNAKVIYQNAYQQALIGGYGCYVVGTEYDNDYNFEQKIKLRGINDATKAFWDVSALDEAKVEGMGSGIRTRMSRKMFAKVYGEKLERKIGNETLTEYTVIADDDSILVVDYYERKYSTETLIELSNGRCVAPDELAEMERYVENDIEILLDGGEPVRIENKRRVPKYTIKHYKLAGEYTLEETELKCKLLPVVFVDQNSYYEKTGKQVCRPFFKDTKDAQRYINYIGTQSAYILKISRYDQFLVSKKNIQSADTAAIWRDPINVQGGLVYDESPSGVVPQRLEQPELSRSLSEQYMRAMQDIQSSTGIYSTQLGQNGNELSGVAIERRIEAAQPTTMIPADGLNRAVARGAEIIDQLIPHVYDTERTLRLNLPDRGPTLVTINKLMDEYGSQIINDMTQGNMRIRLSTGPSWEQQKRETRESLDMMLSHNPQMFPLVGDEYAKTLPTPQANLLANRMKTLVPPEVMQAGETGQVPPKKPQLSPEIIKGILSIMEEKRKQKELTLEQEKLILQALETKGDLRVKEEQIQAGKEEAAAVMRDNEMRYMAEVHRTLGDEQTAAIESLIKLLTISDKKPRMIGE